MQISFKPKIIPILFCAIFLGNLLAQTNATAQMKKPKQAFDESLVVLASSSSTNALVEISEKFSKKENISVGVSFDTTSELEAVIERGEAANVLITEDSGAVNSMMQKGLINVYSRHNIASDRMVIAANKKHFLFKRILQFGTDEKRIEFIAKNSLLVVADPDFDFAGKKFKEAYSKIGDWEFVNNRLIRVANNRSALFIISNGNNPGVVFASDVASDDNVAILTEIPQELYEKIIYQAVIVADITSESDNKHSQTFINYLDSSEAKKVLKSHGLSTL